MNLTVSRATIHWPEESGAQVDRVCARCGRRVEETLRGLCPDCYSQVYGVARIPSSLGFTYCRYCGSFKFRGGWNRPLGGLEETVREYLFTVLTERLRPSEDLDEAWIGGVEVLSSLAGPGIYRVRVVLEGARGGFRVSEERLLTLKVDMAVCPSCTNRITKRGYDAVIQVRSSSGSLGDRAGQVLRLIEDLDEGLRSSIISIEEGRNGIDLLVDDVASARVIASKIRSRFHARVQEAFKLVGRRADGKRRGRLTISLRIPDIGRGDVIRVGGRMYLVLASGRSGFIAIDLSTGREATITGEDLWSRGYTVEHVARRSLLLLGSDRGSMLFMDPVDGSIIEYPAQDVRSLVEELREGSLYSVISHGKLIYVVGEVNE